MTIPPLWQTPVKGRITAMTFGTIFAVQELYFFYFFIYYFWHDICYPPRLVWGLPHPPSDLVRLATTTPPTRGCGLSSPLYRLLHTPPIGRSGLISCDKHPSDGCVGKHHPKQGVT